MLLIIGANGLLGSALVDAALSRGLPCEGTSRKAGAKWLIDLAMPSGEWQIPAGVTSAILCAGITKISACENDPATTRRVNIQSTLELASHLVGVGCRVAFLSSSQVFDQNLEIPPDESTATAPTTEYGRQKSETEKGILQLSPGNLVVRLPKILHRKMALVLNWKQRWGAGEIVEAYSDYYLSPISTAYFAHSLISILQLQHGGIFHLGASDAISYYDFAKWLVSQWGIDKRLLRPSSSASPASPQSSMLGCAYSARIANLSIPNSLNMLQSTFS